MLKMLFLLWHIILASLAVGLTHVMLMQCVPLRIWCNLMQYFKHEHLRQYSGLVIALPR